MLQSLTFQLYSLSNTSLLILLNTLSSCPFPINNVLGKKQIALSQVRVAKRTAEDLNDAYIYESFKLATHIHAE